MSRLLTIIFALGLLAVACNGDAGEGTTTTTAGPDTTTTTAVVTTTAAAETTTSSPAARGGSECLVGSWVLDTEAFVAEMAEIFAGAGMADADISALDGDFTVDFAADGTMNAVREQWGFEIAAVDSTMRIEVNGTESGTWSADDSTLTVNTDVSDLIADTSIVVDGQELPVPPGFEAPGIPDTIASESEYSCEGDVLTISNEGVSSTLNRS